MPQQMDDHAHGTVTTYPVEWQSPMVTRGDEWPERRPGETLEQRLSRVSAWFR